MTLFGKLLKPKSKAEVPESSVINVEFPNISLLNDDSDTETATTSEVLLQNLEELAEPCSDLEVILNKAFIHDTLRKDYESEVIILWYN